MSLSTTPGAYLTVEERMSLSTTPGAYLLKRATFLWQQYRMAVAVGS